MMTSVRSTDRANRVVCFEAKPRPWDPANDKDFALGAPAEDTPEAARYLLALAAQ
jgi:hypothetical protein